MHSCLGFSVASYLPKLVCGALHVGARRYLAAVESPQREKQVLRSCIEESDGSRYLELPRQSVNGEEVLPTLHMVLDQGSIGWPLGLYVVYGLRCRATVHFDIWHRVHNDWNLALKHCGLST
eukprot:4952219-Amphidinium_carterae.1